MRATRLFLAFVLILIPLATACGAYLIIVGVKSTTLIRARRRRLKREARSCQVESDVSSAPLSTMPVAPTERT